MKTNLLKEVIIIILFIAASTLMVFVAESLFFFDENQNMIRSNFTHILFWAFIKSLLIDLGLIVLYFINKGRIKNGNSAI